MTSIADIGTGGLGHVSDDDDDDAPPLRLDETDFSKIDLNLLTDSTRTAPTTTLAFDVRKIINTLKANITMLSHSLNVPAVSTAANAVIDTLTREATKNQDNLHEKRAILDFINENVNPFFDIVNQCINAGQMALLTDGKPLDPTSLQARILARAAPSLAAISAGTIDVNKLLLEDESTLSPTDGDSDSTTPDSGENSPSSGESAFERAADKAAKKAAEIEISFLERCQFSVSGTAIDYLNNWANSVRGNPKSNFFMRSVVFISVFAGSLLGALAATVECAVRIVIKLISFVCPKIFEKMEKSALKNGENIAWEVINQATFAFFENFKCNATLGPDPVSNHEKERSIVLAEMNKYISNTVSKAAINVGVRAVIETAATLIGAFGED